MAGVLFAFIVMAIIKRLQPDYWEFRQRLDMIDDKVIEYKQQVINLQNELA